MKDCDQRLSGDMKIPIDSRLQRRVVVKDCDQRSSDDVKIRIDSELQRRGGIVEEKDYDQNGLSGDVKIPRSRHRLLSGSNPLPMSVGQRGQVSISITPPGVGRRGQDMTFVVVKSEVYCGDNVGCE